MNDLRSKKDSGARGVGTAAVTVEHESYTPDAYGGNIDDQDGGAFNNIGDQTTDLKQKFDTYLPTYELCLGPGAKLRQFVHTLSVLPNLMSTAANRSLLNIANDLAVLDLSGKTEKRFEFYYVSAGPIGNGYYLSTLLCRQFLFETEPIIPVAFLIHERRNLDDHRRLFEMLQEKCADVATMECVFITDREFGDIKSILTSATQLYSWHYFEDDIVNWVENNSGTNDDANTYLTDVYALMKLKALEQFNHELASKRRQWTPDFANFFDTCLKADIIAKGGRWHSEPLRGGVYNNACGVVIPSCSDLNQLVSDLVEWQDVTLDQILQCIYYFSEYYVRENDKAMHQQLGSFKLQTRYMHYSRPTRRLRAFEPVEVNDPRDIVNYVRTTSMAGTH